MVRHVVTVTALAACLAACTGGSTAEDHPGTIDSRSVVKLAERASFPVRLPVRLEARKVLNVGWVAAGENSVQELSFDLVAPGGAIVTVDQAGDAGLIRALVADTTPLGQRRVGRETWRAHRAPSLAGLLLVHRDETGVETAVYGDAPLATLTAVARSLR